MRICVTGGSGFVGTVLVRKLLADGHTVRIFDLLPSESFPNLCMQGDILDLPRLKQAFFGMDQVIHLAAAHRDDIRPISIYHDVNVRGSSNVAEAAASLGIRRVLFTSSVAVYGFSAPVPDEETPTLPTHPYGRTKLEAEGVFKAWASEDRERSLVIVRPTVIFGPRNRGNLFALVNQIHANRFVMIGRGLNTKSLAFVENVADFLIWMIQRAEPGEITVNYADKPDMLVRDLVSVIYRNLGKRPSRLCLPYRLGLGLGYLFDLVARLTARQLPISSVRVKKFCANTAIATGRLEKTGFVALHALEEAVAKTVRHEFPVALADERSRDLVSGEREAPCSGSKALRKG